MRYAVEFTDTFAGEANYSWVRRAEITMPELTHYGYDGATNYVKTNKVYRRELMRKAKAAVKITGLRGVTHDFDGMVEFRPYGIAAVMFITEVTG